MNLILLLMVCAAATGAIVLWFCPAAARRAAAHLLSRAHYLDNIRSDRELRLAQAESLRRQLEREYGV